MKGVFPQNGHSSTSNPFFSKAPRPRHKKSEVLFLQTVPNHQFFPGDTLTIKATIQGRMSPLTKSSTATQHLATAMLSGTAPSA
ncbi:MAG: hypothetical protein OSB05_04545 [Akkermansiaceae bacterium]|nr:hypothetical protein [Akkermansiaceae bacterium]